MKLLILFGVILLLCSVYAGSTIWSNPSVDVRVQSPIIIKPETHPCSNNEWNGYFEDYRNGLINRNETIKLLRGCERW